MLLCWSGEVYRPLPSFEFDNEFGIAVLCKWSCHIEDCGCGVFVGAGKSHALPRKGVQEINEPISAFALTGYTSNC
jgi:hypothetical protein